MIEKLKNKFNFHPRRWWNGFTSYNRYMGYIKPVILSTSEKEFKAWQKIFSTICEPRLLTAPLGKKILVISPHPDDESIGCGGLLLAHKNVSEIHLLLVTAGEKGGISPSAHDQQTHVKTIATTRKEEFHTVAALLQAKSIQCLDFPDNNIPLDKTAIDKVTSAVSKIAPDVIILPWMFDDHIDHRRTNMLYAAACRHREGIVFSYEIWSLLQPNVLFDVSKHLDEKIDLLNIYRSQMESINYVNYIKAVATIRAFQYPSAQKRGDGALEAFFSLPNTEYCELVLSLYEKNNLIHAPEKK